MNHPIDERSKHYGYRVENTHTHTHNFLRMKEKITLNGEAKRKQCAAQSHRNLSFIFPLFPVANIFPIGDFTARAIPMCRCKVLLICRKKTLRASGYWLLIRAEGCKCADSF